MGTAPNQEKGQSVFHHTPLNAGEEKLVSQSNAAPSCTEAPLYPWQYQTALIEREVCQEISLHL